jgi:trehalose transport system substrate-binding protein
MAPRRGVSGARRGVLRTPATRKERERMDFLHDVVTNLVAGIVGTGLLATLALLLRRVGPDRVQQCLDLSRRYLWNLLALGFLASAIVSAAIQGLNPTRLAVLGGVAGAVGLLLIARRFAPVRFRTWEALVWRHPWELLAGVFLLTTLAQLVLPSDPILPVRMSQIVFVVDMAPEELIGLREVLNELEPQLQARVFLMNVPADQYVPELDRMVNDGRVKWDLIAADNNMLGVLGARCLVQDQERHLSRGVLRPRHLISTLGGLYTYKGSSQSLFVPFRPNVMVAYFNKAKFRSLQLAPPRDWQQLLNVARTLHAQAGAGRVAIQGYPGKPTAVTVFEFVRAAGGNPLTLNDPESVAAFEYLQELEPYLAPEYRSTRFDTANRALIADRVDLVMNWTFGIKVVLEDAGLEDEIGVYSGWRGPNGEAHVLGGDVLAIPRGAPNSDKAARLIEMLVSREVQQKLLTRLRWLPIRSDASEGLPPAVQAIFDDAVTDAIQRAELRPTNPQWGLAEKELDGAFDSIVRQRGAVTALQGYAANLKQIPRDVKRYTVQTGDTLQLVAAQHGTTPYIVAGSSGIEAADPIVPGQVLLVPGLETNPCPP